MSSCKGRGEPIKRGEMYFLSLGKHRMRLAKLPHTNGDWQCQSPVLVRGAAPKTLMRSLLQYVQKMHTLESETK